MSWRHADISSHPSRYPVDPYTSPFKIMTKVKPDGHIWGPEFNQYVCLLFHDNRTIFGWDSKFSIWPWKFKVKFMAKVKSDGHIWGLEFNQYVWFSFCDKRIISGWDIQIPHLALKIHGQGHDDNWPKSNQAIYRSEPSILPRMKQIPKFVRKLSNQCKTSAKPQSPLLFRCDLVSTVLISTNDITLRPWLLQYEANTPSVYHCHSTHICIWIWPNNGLHGYF